MSNTADSKRVIGTYFFVK